jgi:Carboxypeptidase regulatory-like domain
MYKSKLAIFIVSLLLVATLSVDIRAQAVYGSIAGNVSDAQGAAIVGAAVTVTNIEQNVSTSAKTNDVGHYQVTHLIPGRYQVKVEQQGYKTAVQEVLVKADVSTTTDLAIEVGAISETVTISSEAVELSLKTDRSDVATNFSQRQVQELPTFDRNFTRFLLLTPGTQQLPGWQHAASENPQGSTQIMVNGQHFSGTSYQLDGTDNRDPILGIIVINPTLESVTQAKVTTQNYDAEFGQATAGVVTAQTRSGSNQPHGSVFMFRRNDLTQARDPFSEVIPDPLTGKIIPDQVWSQFGGSLGWRIIKDKNFIFGDYQGTRSKEGGSVRTTVPIGAARTPNAAGFFDLSAYPFQIYDPATGNPTTGLGRTPFVGNLIPAARVSAQARALLALLPQPNQLGTFANYSTTGAGIFNGDQFNIRDDHYWSQNLHIFGRFSYAKYARTKPGAFGDVLGGPNLSGPRFGGASNSRDISVAAGFDYALSPRTVTDFRLGFFQYKVNVLPGGVGSNTAQMAGIPGLNVDDLTSYTPAFVIQTPGAANNDASETFKFGYGLVTNGCNCPLIQQEEQIQFVNNWSFIGDKHIFKFGGDLRFARNLRVPSDAPRAGLLQFNTAGTAQVNADGTTTANTGLGLATFLLGNVSEFRRYVSTTTDARERQRRWFFYGQDTWRYSQKLTINYGLRWELIFPETVKRPGDGSLLNLQTGELFVGNVGEVNDHFNVAPTYKALAPRLGIAYQWKQKTVIRAGYGRSFDVGVFGSIFGHTVTQNLPVIAFQSLNPPGGNYNSVFSLSSGPSAPVFPDVPSNGRLPLPIGIEGRARPFRQRLPTLDAWNVTVQHQFGPNTSLEAGYVGNKGTHVFYGDGPGYNANQPVSNLAVPSTDLRRPFFSSFGWTQNITYYGNDADNHYNALQTKFETRFSDLNILAHYTWQASRNYSDEYIHDKKVVYGPSGYDRTHVIVFSEVWDLPIGRGRKYMNGISRGLDYLVGGWQINSSTTWQSGLPFTPTLSSCPGTNAGPCRPNRIGNPYPDNQNRDQWFIGGVGPGTPWAVPGPNQFGDAGRNSLRGPSFWQADLSIFKDFRVTESTKVEFRAEAFNVFNHVNLGIPNSTVDNPGAGQITSTQPPGSRQRQWQFGARFLF